VPEEVGSGRIGEDNNFSGGKMTGEQKADWVSTKEGGHRTTEIGIMEREEDSFFFEGRIFWRGFSGGLIFLAPIKYRHAPTHSQ